MRTRRHRSLTVRYRVRKGSNRRDSLQDALTEATSGRAPGPTAILSTPALSRRRAEAGRRMYGDGSDTFPAHAPELSTRPFVLVTASEVNNNEVATRPPGLTCPTCVPGFLFAAKRPKAPALAAHEARLVPLSPRGGARCPSREIPGHPRPIPESSDGVGDPEQT